MENIINWFHGLEGFADQTNEIAMQYDISITKFVIKICFEEI